MGVALEDHLVAGGQREPGGDDGVALGGVAREAELVGPRPQKGRHGLARRGQQIVPGLGMLLQARGHRGHLVQHQLRGRPEPAGVQIDRVVEEGKERPHAFPEQLRPRRIKHRRSQRGDGDAAHRAGGRQARGPGAEAAQEGFSVEAQASVKVRV